MLLGRGILIPGASVYASEGVENGSPTVTSVGPTARSILICVSPCTAAGSTQIAATTSISLEARPESLPLEAILARTAGSLLEEAHQRHVVGLSVGQFHGIDPQATEQIAEPLLSVQGRLPERLP